MRPSSVVCLFALASAALASRVAPDLAAAAGDTGIDVIVQFSGEPDPALLGEVTAHGGVFKRTLGVAHAALFSLPLSALHAVASQPHVVYISPDRRLASGAAEDPAESVDTPMARVRQPRLTDSALMTSIARAMAAPAPRRVLVLTAGRPVVESYRLDPLGRAVEEAWNAGLTVVAAAGDRGFDNSFANEGYGTIQSPANHPFIITAGALEPGSTGAAATGSKGPTLIDHIVKPDLVATAPGSRRSADAARVVGAAVQRLLDSQPSLTPGQVKARLMSTARKDLPSFSLALDPATGAHVLVENNIFAVGAGILDLPAALQTTELAPRPAISPSVVYDPASGGGILLAPDGSLWASSAAWAPSSVWGFGLGLDSVVWCDSVVWGSVVRPRDAGGLLSGPAR